jgi:uncharacterized membrane protein
MKLFVTNLKKQTHNIKYYEFTILTSIIGLIQINIGIDVSFKWLVLFWKVVVVLEPLE